jgi:predicted HD superfamily hydrolase involved in NAD metabolism
VLILYKVEEIKQYLQDSLRPNRYKHSIGVRDTALRLAEIYGVDKEKAKVAGLLHDCAKCMDDKKMIEEAIKYAINIDYILENQPSLLHGPVGAYIAREQFNIDDDIFRAIYYHTTGDVNMDMLTKVIYISDYIEPSRKFPGVEELRKLTYKDIDKALVVAFDNTIKYVLGKSQLVYCKTVEARNFLLLDIGKR